MIWFVAASWVDGPPAPAGLAAVVGLLGAAAAGWWWLERSADGPVADQHRPGGRADADRVRAEELADSRAELAVRTCSHAPPADRVRVEGLVHLWLREGRSGFWVALFLTAVPVLLVVTGGSGDGRGVPWPAAVLWAVAGLLVLGRSVHRRRLARRWLAAHGTAPGVAGHP